MTATIEECRQVRDARQDIFGDTSLGRFIEFVFDPRNVIKISDNRSYQKVIIWRVFT